MLNRLAGEYAKGPLGMDATRMFMRSAGLLGAYTAPFRESVPADILAEYDGFFAGSSGQAVERVRGLMAAKKPIRRHRAKLNSGRRRTSSGAHSFPR